MFKGAYVRNKDELHFVTLRNISESGLCFDVFPGVEVGAEIEFCFDSVEPKTGVVKWVQDGRFGVNVPEGSLLLPHQTGARPRTVRVPLSVKARVYIDGQRTEVSVHNLSLRGFCVDHVTGMRVGQLISIELGGHSFALATVRWLRNNRAGICLAEPVQFAQFRELVNRLQELQTHSAMAGPEEVEARQSM
jgi:hypothetical protein